MNADTLVLDTPMPLPSLRSREWIWAARILLALVFLATGAMRMTLPAAELARLGDWTQPFLPPLLTGILQGVAGLTLLLPRRLPWGAATLLGSFLLASYLLGSLLTHLTAGSPGWFVDGLRLLGLSAVLQDLLQDAFLRVRTA